MIDFRNTPPPDKYGYPGTNFPTSNPRDLLIIDDFPVRTSPYHGFAYGVPHPKQSECILTWQGPVKGNGNEKSVRWIFANPRLAQEQYNLVQGAHDDEDSNFPSFVRSQLVLRSEYESTRPTMGNPLTALIGVTLTPGATALANGQYALTISGSGGAAGYFEVVGGSVVGAFLTNSGTGYDSASPPTVGAASTSATLVAVMQPKTALLVSEREQPAEEMLNSMFVRSIRRYETIPGSPSSTQHWDGDADILITTTRTKKKISAITPGVEIDATGGNKVVKIELEEIDAIFGWEIKTITPESPFHDEDSAKVTDQELPYRFPPRVDYATLISYGGVLVGFRSPLAENVKHTTKTWWVISATKPDVDVDEILYGDTLYLPNGVSFRDAIRNEAAVIYDFGTVVYDASTPDFDAFHDSWIGNPKVIRGGVTDVGSVKRWRVTSTSVVMQ